MMITNYEIMKIVIEENLKHPMGVGDQILLALKIKEKNDRSTEGKCAAC